MSDFSSLKKQRKAREPKSYVISSPETKILQYDSTFNFDHDLNPDAMKVDLNSTAQNSTSTEGKKAEILKTNGLYKTLPDSLDIRVSINGRGIYSKYHRRPGDVLFSVEPHVAALSNEHLDEYCSSCFSPKANSLQRCTGCKLLCYCDAKCQSSDWNQHKQECSAIQRWSLSALNDEKLGRAPIPGDAIRCLGRILHRKHKLGPESVWAKEMDAMESHRASINKDPNSYDSQIYTQLAHAVVHFLGLTSPQDMAEYGMRSAADLVDLVSRFTTNTFTISTPALAPLGACVSPTVALINHSCDPNAVVVFPRAGGWQNKLDEPLMQVIGLKHISPDEEILTAYIDTTLPRQKRQKMLKETYHFSCCCSLCVPSSRSIPDFREAMWCPKKCGGTCALPTEANDLTRCNRCKTPVRDTDAVLDAVRVGEEALHKAEALQFSDPKKAIQLTTNLVPILVSAGLVPAAYPVLALSRLNASLLIAHLPSSDPEIEEVFSPAVRASHLEAETQKITPTKAQEALDDAIRAATRASTGLSQILTEGHPVRGIALVELGKLLSVDEPQPSHVGPNATPTVQTSLPSSSLFVLNPKLQAPPYPPSGPPRLKLSYETLMRARMELMIGFGSGKNQGGEVGKQVRQLLVDIEKELMVWKSGVRNALQDRPVTPRKVA